MLFMGHGIDIKGDKKLAEKWLELTLSLYNVHC
jgi:hypothetical protein